VDRATVAVYEARAREWQRRRGDATDGLGRRLREEVGPGVVADLGCGTGRYFEELGFPVVGVDATSAMLELARSRSAPLVQADLEALPFRTGQLAGAFARHSYLHVPKVRLPKALVELRRVIRPGGRVLLSMIEGEYEGSELPDDDFPGRFFALWSAHEIAEALHGAGFVDVRTSAHGSGVLVIGSR
jgi:SAM-dependent methyltransferase